MVQQLHLVKVMLNEFEERDEMATPTEACREYARNVGADRPESPFILTNYDTWEPNSYFTGPRCHQLINPESEYAGEEYEAHAACDRGYCLAAWKGPRHDPYLAGRGLLTAHQFVTDDLPF